MRNRKNALMSIVVVICLLMCCLTACGPSSAEETPIETTTAKAESTEVLQIQNIEKITLEEENSKLPYEIKMYDTATEAYNNPVVIVKENKNGGSISFSFTSESENIDFVEGIVIEYNDIFVQSVFNSSGEVECVGEIETFSLDLPLAEGVSTVVYEIHTAIMDEGTTVHYMAFRMEVEEPATSK